MILTHYAFVQRMTDVELATIYTAAKRNIMFEVWLKKFELAQDVDTGNPEIIQGLVTMEALGIIGTGRASAISGIPDLPIPVIPVPEPVDPPPPAEGLKPKSGKRWGR